jgi:hypothetical protein
MMMMMESSNASNVRTSRGRIACMSPACSTGDRRQQSIRPVKVSGCAAGSWGRYPTSASVNHSSKSSNTCDTGRCTSTGERCLEGAAGMVGAKKPCIAV